MDDIISYLLSVVGSIVSYIDALATFLADFIQYVAIVLYDILLGLYQFLLGLFKILVSGLGHIIQDILTGDFQDLWQDIQNLRAALAAYIAPVMQAIRAEQQYLQHLFNLYLKPVLAFIQSLRHVLELLKAAGVKWAGTLDNYLATVEDYILQAYQAIITAINRHADIFEYLLSPLGFLQIIPLLHIVVLRAEDLTRMWTGRGLLYYGTGADAGGKPPVPLINVVTYYQGISAGIANKSGDAQDWMDGWNAINESLDSDEVMQGL